MVESIQIPDGVLLLEPRETYDKALIGFTTTPQDHWPRETNTLVAIYSAEKCIEALMEAEGWDYDDSVEWFEFNTSGAWVGEGTPTFQSEDPEDITD